MGLTVRSPISSASDFMKFSRNYFTFPLYLPRICLLLENWPRYLFNYLSRGRRPAEYKFRSGYRMLDVSGTLAGTIAVVFVRREYGMMKEFRTIIDIGANMGSFTLYAAEHCPGARIYCYEPEPRNFECLRQNISINALENRVVAIQSAVASTSGRREMAMALSPLHSLVTLDGADERQFVNCMTLADIFSKWALERVDLLKMNCEGAEYEILGSCAREHLDRIRNIRLEYHVLDAETNNSGSLCRLLENRGFRIERLTRYKGESGFIWAGRS